MNFNFNTALRGGFSGLLLLLTMEAEPQERPYFVTYTHDLEEPDHLEVGLAPLLASPGQGPNFRSTSLELEYGAKGWWTTELYLDGEATSGESALFTGFRVENRVRPFLKEHVVNPVLYVEYEELTGADKTLLEVVGFDSAKDFSTLTSALRRDKLHELETRLILSSNTAGWNASANLIFEKNLSGGPWEFGYAFGVSRPLAQAARPDECHLCPELLKASLEVYGGLGTAHNVTLASTSHYLAPSLSWEPGRGISLRVSPGFGLTDASHRFLLRFGVSIEIPNLSRRLKSS